MENQPSGRRLRALFHRIQESGGVSGLELLLTSETSETAILAENRKKNTTKLVALTKTTKIVIEKPQRKTEVTDTAPSCNYCVARIVARPLRTTVKGEKPAFRKENKSLISPDSGIRRGLGTGTFINLYKSCHV